MRNARLCRCLSASVFSLVALGCLSAPAWARPETESSVPVTVLNREALERSGVSDLKVFVTASRGAEQNPLDVPQALSSVTRDTIDSTEYVDAHDAIQDLPNIGLAPAEGNPNYWQQGFTIRGLGAQRVLTLTDGVRQAGQGIGYGGGNLSLYDTFGIERIEVLRGPASVLYGTDAFGGVINVITRNPRKRTEFGINGGGRYTFDSSRDMNRVGAYTDFGDDKYGVVFGSSYTHSGRPNLPDGEDPKSGSYRNLGFFGKADFFLSKDTKFRFLGNVDRNSDVLIDDDSITLPIAKFPPPGASAMITSPLYFQFPTYQRSLVGMELTSENVTPSLEHFQSGLYWQQLYRRFHRETAFYPTFSPGFAGPPLFYDPSATVTTSETDTRDRVNTFEWQNQARFNYNPHVVTIGADLAYDNAYLPETETQRVVGQAGVGAVNGVPTSVDRVRADANQYRLGLYAQDSWNLAPFEVIPGVRFDYHSVKDDQSDFDDSVWGFSGSVGTVYHQNDRQSLYMTLATGFRAPDLGERFQDGIVNLGAPSRVIGKADLNAEHSYSAEWGLKRRDGALDTDFAVFVNHITEYIGKTSLGVVDGFATEQYDNVGSVNLYGGEIASRYALDDRWSVYANAGRTWTRDSEKVDLLNWVFNYGTDYVLPVNVSFLEKVTAGIQGRTMLNPKDTPQRGGRQPFEGSGFTVVDLKLNMDLGKTRFGRGSIVSGVRNLFDREYREPFFTLLQPERNAFVSLQFDF